MKKNLHTLLSLALLLLMGTGKILAASITVSSNTLWSSINTGSGPGGLPSAADDVTVTNGAVLTVSSAAACANLDIQDGTVDVGGINFTVGNTLTVSGSINFSSTSGNKTFTNISINGGGTWTSLVAENFSIAGNLIQSGTFNAGAGIYTFSAAGGNINGIGGTTIAKVVISGSLNNLGSLNVSTSLSGSGSLTQGNGSSLIVAGTNTLSTLDASTNSNTVEYNSSASQTILGGITYHHLIISNAGNSTLGGAISINGNLSINGGTMVCSTHQITGNAIGTLSVAAGCGLSMGSTSSASVVDFPSNFTTGNITLDNASTVTYQGGYNQNISGTPSTYGNLTISAGAGTFTKNYTGISLQVNGNLVLTGSTNTFALGTADLNVDGNISGTGALSFISGDLTAGGNFTTSGAFTAGSGTVTYDGNNQTIKGTTYNDIVFAGSGIKTPSTVTTVAGSATIATGSTLNASSRNVTFNNSLLIDGTFMDDNAVGSNIFRGLVTLNGTWNISVTQAIRFQNGLINNGSFTSGSGIYTFGNNNQSITGTQPVTIAGKVIINGAITVSNFVALSIGDDINGTATTSTLLNSGGASINFGTNAFAVKGILNASANPNTITYSSNAAHNIYATTYHHLIKSGSGAATMAGGTVNGDLSINAGNLTIINSTLVGNASGNLSLGSGSSLILGLSSAVNAVNFPSNFITANVTLNSNSTVSYQANSASQVISSVPSYGNLVVTTGSNAVSKMTDGGSITINTDLTITDGAGTCELNIGAGSVSLTGNLEGDGDIEMSSGSLTLNGNWNNTGTLTPGTGTVTYNGSSSQNIAGVSYHHLTSSSTGARVLPNGGTVSVAGTFTPGTNVYTITGSTVRFNGSAAQTISAFDFENLTIENNAGVGISGNIDLTGTLKLQTGNLDVSGGVFTLISTASASAGIAKIEAGASLSGNIVLQRFMPGGRAGQVFLSTPIQSSPITAWMDDFATSGFPGATGSAGGFVSVYSYNETAPGAFNNGLTPPTNASNIVNPGQGYWVFVGTSPTTATNIIVDVTGAITSGDFSFPVTYTNSGTPSADGWNMVANPYPSTIDWDAASGWTKTNFDDAVYIWNAELGASGGYATYIAGVGTGGGSRYIPHSQAFYAIANAGSPVLECTEDVKVSNNVSFMRTAPVANNFFHVDLFNANHLLLDEAAIRFHEKGSANFDKELDAYKPELPGFVQGSTISSVSNGINYSVNTLGEFTEETIIPLNLKVEGSGKYEIGFSGIQTLLQEASLSLSNASIVLVDKQLNTITDLRVNNAYAFSTNEKNISQRFEIRILPAGEAIQSSSNSAETIQLIQDGSGFQLLFNLAEKANVSVEIMNALGQTFASEQIGQMEKGNHRIENRDFAQGAYLIRVNTGKELKVFKVKQ
jgi:hypothetical protein